jgi:hypothetical protein
MGLRLARSDVVKTFLLEKVLSDAIIVLDGGTIASCS